jgi:hypothetical protein
MKKGLFLVLVAIFAIAVFAGCAGGESEAASPAGRNGEAEEVTEEIFDGGNLSVIVPKGWAAFHGPDIFEEYEEGYDPNVVQICKGGKSEVDLFTNPYIQIKYYGSDVEMWGTPSKDFYEETRDIEPMKLGNYTWEGFTGKSMDLPLALLWTEDGDDQFQVTVWQEVGGEKIGLGDADVQVILSNMTLK